LFTLLDKSPFYGNINRTLEETSLNDASILLNATIRAGKLFIPFIVDNQTVSLKIFIKIHFFNCQIVKFVELVANQNSLKELVESDNVPFKGNSNWCVPLPVSTGPSYPTLPVEFQTIVEANYRDKNNNFTAEYAEYYDFINNRGTIVQFSLLSEVRQYFLYDTNEMITTFSNINLLLNVK
jgi:hypothetical protein